MTTASTAGPAVLFTAALLFLSAADPKPKQVTPKLSHRSVNLLRIGGLSFKDLNKNGRLDPYEDWRRNPRERAADLLRKMTDEEKAGLMMHGTIPANGPAGMENRYDLPQAAKLIREAKVNTFITRLSGNANDLAAENNKLQEIAEADRLAIPVTISTDPRNQFRFTMGAGVAAETSRNGPDPLVWPRSMIQFSHANLPT